MQISFRSFRTPLCIIFFLDMASASRLKNYGLRPGFGLELCGLVAALFCRKKLLRVKVFACFLCTCELRSS